MGSCRLFVEEVASHKIDLLTTKLKMKTLLFLFAFVLIVCKYTSFAQGGLDNLRKNIPGEPGKDYPTFGPSILCKINPAQCGVSGGGGKRGGGNGGGNRKKNGGGSRKRNNQNGNHASPKPEQQKTRNTSSNKGSKSDLAAQAAAGNIPGTPGKDYPINSLSAWRKRPGYENIELAPADLVVAGYPFPNGGGSGGKKNKKRPGAAPPLPISSLSGGSTGSSGGSTGSSGGSTGSSGGSTGYCPGASL